MKKITEKFFITITIIASMLLFSCNDKSKTNEKIVLEVASTQVKFMATGIGNMTIDWGDDSTPELFTLTNIKSGYQHQYQNDNKHIIEITGHIVYFYAGRFEIDGSYTSNQIKLLNASNSFALKQLDCSENIITQLDVSKCTALMDLDCWDNQLTTLNVADCKALVNLRCQKNQLINVDFINNEALTILSCSDNTITNLDMSSNTKLKELYVQKNNLSHIAINNLFETLHDKDIAGGKFISISDNMGSPYCDTNIAVKKGWKVYR